MASLQNMIVEPETENKIIEQMSTLSAKWEAAGDQRAVFLSCYGMMTYNVLKAIRQGKFHDSEWAGRLLQRFAEYYFNALEAYECEPASSPLVWRTVFDYAKFKEIWPLQHLLFGVNAHINFDLVLSLVDVLQPEWEKLSQEQRDKRYADHCRVNLIIGQTIDAVQDQVLEPTMPALEWVDNLFGRADEWLISRLIAGWRERVWQDAVILLGIHDAAHRSEFIERVEKETLRLTQAIFKKQWMKIA